MFPNRAQVAITRATQGDYSLSRDSVNESAESAAPNNHDASRLHRVQHFLEIWRACDDAATDETSNMIERKIVVLQSTTCHMTLSRVVLPDPSVLNLSAFSLWPTNNAASKEVAYTSTQPRNGSQVYDSLLNYEWLKLSEFMSKL